MRQTVREVVRQYNTISADSIETQAELVNAWLIKRNNGEVRVYFGCDPIQSCTKWYANIIDISSEDQLHADITFQPVRIWPTANLLQEAVNFKLWWRDCELNDYELVRDAILEHSGLNRLPYAHKPDATNKWAWDSWKRAWRRVGYTLQQLRKNKHPVIPLINHYI